MILFQYLLKKQTKKGGFLRFLPSMSFDINRWVFDAQGINCPLRYLTGISSPEIAFQRLWKHWLVRFINGLKVLLFNDPSVIKVQ